MRIILIIFIMRAVLAHNDVFTEFVCQQCNSLGLTGPAGPPCQMNETAIREILQQEFTSAIDKKYPKSCDESVLLTSRRSRNISGVMKIYPTGFEIETYCILRDDEIWTVIQRRQDGSVDFFRDWNDYVAGFGNAKTEYWLGLEAIHQLTKDGEYLLRVDMTEMNGTRMYAEYRTFTVASSSDNYRLSIGGYSGTAGDEMRFHDGIPFSTKDADNDTWERNCASTFKGGWWYHACHGSNLNGKYGMKDTTGLAWHIRPTKQWMHMRFTEMKIRKKI